MISLFLSFKAKKAKKAAIVAVKAKLHMKKFVEPKILTNHPEEVFKLPKTQNRAGILKFRPFKSQNVPKSPQY